jgi:hypothetical protein
MANSDFAQRFQSHSARNRDELEAVKQALNRLRSHGPKRARDKRDQRDKRGKRGEFGNILNKTQHCKPPSCICSRFPSWFLRLAAPIGAFDSLGKTTGETIDEPMQRTSDNLITIWYI